MGDFVGDEDDDDDDDVCDGLPLDPAGVDDLVFDAEDEDLDEAAGLGDLRGGGGEESLGRPCGLFCSFFSAGASFLTADLALAAAGDFVGTCLDF